MRTILSAITAVILLFSTCLAASAETTTFIVNSTVDNFQDTGVELKAGSQLSITTTGTVCHNNGGSCFDAYGMGWWGPAPGDFLAPGLRVCGLVGKIGNGAPFDSAFITSMKVMQTGELYLGFNDDYFSDNSGSFLATITVNTSCDLNIGANQTQITAYSGDDINISGTITDSSGQAITWTLNIIDRTFTGSGTSISSTWNGTDASGNIVAPGSYSATLTARTADGQCTDSKTVNINIVKQQQKDQDDCDDPCTCNLTETNSKINLKSGNYYHSQNVIAKPLSLNLNLSYNSLETREIPLGKGWSHDYNMRLFETTGKITLKLGGGDIRNYILSGSYYLPESTSNDNSRIIKNADNSYTRIFKNGNTQTFNSTGRLTAITDANGNKTTLMYSGSDLSTITDSAGRALSITSAGGRIISITDPAGKNTSFTYSGNLLTTVTDPAGNIWQYAYDANGKMIQKTDPEGHQSSNVYDASGKNTGSTDPEGKTKTISYDSATSSTITEKDGSSWTRTYDSALNAPTSTTDQLGNVTNSTYDGRGNLLTRTTPDGNTSTYTYDTNNNLLSETDQLGKTTSYTYNSLGNVLTKTDPNGHVITNTYDAKGNLLSTTDPAGAKTVYTYDAKGYLLTITDPLGKKIKFAYDTYNNLISVTDQSSRITHYTYDAVGNLLTVTDPANKITNHEYDSMNHLVKTTDPLGYLTQFTYDKTGNRLTVTDGNGKTTTYIYNYKNQPLTINDAQGNVTAMSYSGTGCGSCGGSGTDKLVSVTDADNNITRYEYNPTGKLAKEIDPKGNITSFQYDNNSRLISKTDGNAKTTTYSYDATGRITSKTYQDGTSDTFSYDNAGNMISAGNGNISYTLAYDANNRLKDITDNSGRTVSYTLDKNGNRTQMTVPDGRNISYTYDARNRLTKLVNDGNTYAFTYDALSRRTKLLNPNGSYTTYAYDVDSRITVLTTKTSSGDVINKINHSYDKTINRIKKTEPGGTTNYIYDDIYRLTKATQGKAIKEQYTYDATGNRTSGPQAVTTYTIDLGNQLKATSNAAFAYDGNGNIITKTEGGITYSYMYDGENRLVEVQNNGNSIATYKYDPFGRRIEKTVNGVTTKYLYDGANILYEYDGSGNVTARYTHNLGIDDPLGIEKYGQLYAYHKDTLGSIRAITDSTQAVINTYSYDSFGNTTQTGALSQPYGFTGRIWDTETGLYDYRARTLDPKIGRFIQKDPIGFRGGINLYAYVHNNPINYTDPSGLTWRESLKYFVKWTIGQPVPTDFGPGTNQVNDMKNAPGVQKAKDAFYKKNSGKACSEREPLTNYKGDFGLKGFWEAGLNPTKQFVGSYRVDITPNSDGSININLNNATSFTSFSYGLGPSWNGGPGGTQTQNYHWTEP